MPRKHTCLFLCLFLSPTLSCASADDLKDFSSKCSDDEKLHSLRFILPCEFANRHTLPSISQTRKGEKRRIPNGERKRKSTGNAPENSGNGAFRAVGNGSAAVKNQDGPSDPKRVALDRSQEGGQR